VLAAAAGWLATDLRRSPVSRGVAITDVGADAGTPTSGASTTESTNAPAVPTGPTVPTRSARIGDQAAGDSVVPLAVRIPAIGVDAAIVPVGVAPAGDLEVPEAVATVGWYEHGPLPGGRGSALLAGHVDSREQGRGAFFALRDLQPGADVEVVAADGSVSRWIVRAVQQVAKDELPVEVWRRSGPPVITLVTCGGDFDDGSYRDNIVVVAEPAPPAP
jgi:sortase (surface protein transpeptidase)